MRAKVQVNSTARRPYEVTCASSNTLACGDHRRLEATRTDLIEATVQALAGGSDPRLDQSRAHA
jgi:hypothetical protein